MWQFVEYLKRPELVVAVQEWFGVEYKRNNDDGTSNGDTNCDGNHMEDVNCQKQQHESTSTGTHKRNISNQSTTSDTSDCDSGKCTENDNNRRYRITNRFWYYLFVIGTEFGDELFYATMIPFWFWNIDGAVGRRVVFVWSVVMYVGQGLKDIIRWPRPGPPVQRLQSKWSIEYGMPSTHAMVRSMSIVHFNHQLLDLIGCLFLTFQVSIAMPFSVVIYMVDRYQFSVTIGLVLATLWCMVICFSRIYLGMHSVAVRFASVSFIHTNRSAKLIVSFVCAPVGCDCWHFVDDTHDDSIDSVGR